MRDRDLFRHVYHQLTESLGTKQSGRSFVGFLMATTGLLVLAFPVWIVARDPQIIVAAIREVIETW
jgi:hypothetical protein